MVAVELLPPYCVMRFEDFVLGIASGLQLKAGPT